MQSVPQAILKDVYLERIMFNRYVKLLPLQKVLIGYYCSAELYVRERYFEHVAKMELTQIAAVPKIISGLLYLGCFPQTVTH